jgi:hypothetical protein
MTNRMRFQLLLNSHHPRNYDVYVSQLQRCKESADNSFHNAMVVIVILYNLLLSQVLSDVFNTNFSSPELFWSPVARLFVTVLHFLRLFQNHWAILYKFGKIIFWIYELKMDQMNDKPLSKWK